MELPSVPPSVISDIEAEERRTSRFENSLDQHVDDVLRRPSKFRRTIKGVWSFLKTRESLSLLTYLILKPLFYSDGSTSFPVLPMRSLSADSYTDHHCYIRLPSW
jgi:hypothetical protein